MSHVLSRGASSKPPTVVVIVNLGIMHQLPGGCNDNGGYARTPQRGGQCSSRVPTLERPPGTPVEGSLLGPEFTSPLASGGRRDDGWGGGGASGGWGGGAMDDDDAGWGGHVKGN